MGNPKPQMLPNPDCKKCKGKGKITRTVKKKKQTEQCFCVKRRNPFDHRQIPTIRGTGPP